MSFRLFIAQWLVQIAALFLPVSGTLSASEPAVSDLAELSLEELLNVTVTSVSKREQAVSKSAAAVFVITQEDIRRSGATSIPEVLRMAPGLQVARISSSEWAISARGFNEMYATKLLILMDGRTVYNSLFSGVDWNLQDTLLEDIERIEVIRGPGATLWGANAVNGVINIITKQARETQGALTTFGFGSEEQGFGGVRYGDRIGENGYYRAFIKYFNRDESYDGSLQDPNDDWDMWRTGFRLDRYGTEGSEFTLQGELFNGDVGQKNKVFLLQPPYANDIEGDQEMFGSYLLARLTRTLTASSEYSLQAYYDYYDRNSLLSRQRHNIFDLDFQHAFGCGTGQEIVWGVAYRLVLDDLDQSTVVSFDPEHRRDQLFSGFLQDEITLFPERVRMMVGSKIEHNDYSGFEIQPNLRFLFTFTRRQAAWLSVARAVRTPSRGEHDAELAVAVLGPDNPLNPTPLPVAVTATGNHDFVSENLVAYEAGYRLQGARWFMLDIAAFYHDYHDLRNAEFRSISLDDSPQLHLAATIQEDNNCNGHTYGIEAAVDLQIQSWWRMQVVYTYLRMQLDPDSDFTDEVIDLQEGYVPRHQMSFRSLMDLQRGLEWDVWIRSVGRLPDLGVPGYVSLDVRLGWKFNDALELSLVGQNLLDDHHPEFLELKQILSNDPHAWELERSLYGKVAWRF